MNYGKYLNNFKKISLILLISLFLIEIFSKIILKLDFFRSFEHSNLTFSFTEFDEEKSIDLKKSISLNKDIKIFTDKNRFRVKDFNYNTDLKNDNPKFVFLGDSVPFGWGVNYEDSVPGHFEKIDNRFQIINAAVPSYTPKQSIKKFLNFSSKIKNLEYLYISNFNPLDLYLLFGEKWNENINWSNYLEHLSKDLFFFKYKRIPLWGEISSFKILRKIYVINFFRINDKIQYNKTKLSDQKFINYYTDQLENLKDLTSEKLIIIYTPIFTPLHLKKNNEITTTIEKEKLNLMNKINLNLKNYENENFVFLDIISFMKNQKINQVFIDDCCHLSSFGAKIIADNLNLIINKY